MDRMDRIKETMEAVIEDAIAEELGVDPKKVLAVLTSVDRNPLPPFIFQSTGKEKIRLDVSCDEGRCSVAIDKDTTLDDILRRIG